MKRTLLALSLLALSAQAGAVLLCVNTDANPPVFATWYIGQDATPIHNVNAELADFGGMYCQATSAELVYIEKNFPNLHIRANRRVDGNQVVLWRNDDAMFIADNL